ncbi:hypothetical protein TruAng_004439 [Truncatella angustata]|nr:hypothetical protein TruAng_004439 [Truncatella angustata]
MAEATAFTSKPLYPAYLPTRPDGFTATLDVPSFEADEPGVRADPSKPHILRPGVHVESITPRIGSEIRGVQLSELSTAGLELLTGYDQQHPTMGYPAGTGPEFHVVYADETVGNLRTLLGPRTSYDLWHVDQTFTSNLPSTTFFWVLEMPKSGGGDTVFTSLTAAYEALSPTFKHALAPLSLLHSSASIGEIARVGMERALREAVKTTHPLVIKHPVTGKPSLFVNPTIARQVEGMLPEESEAILRFLHEHIRSLDFSCRLKWEKGSVVVWDQRGVAHSAVPDFKDGERRHMVRMIPYGSRSQPAFPYVYGNAGKV